MPTAWISGGIEPSSGNFSQRFGIAFASFGQANNVLTLTDAWNTYPTDLRWRFVFTDTSRDFSAAFGDCKLTTRLAAQCEQPDPTPNGFGPPSIRVSLGAGNDQFTTVRDHVANVLMMSIHVAAGPGDDVVVLVDMTPASPDPMYPEASGLDGVDCGDGNDRVVASLSAQYSLRDCEQVTFLT